MTRLLQSDVESIADDLTRYDQVLVERTGLTLRQIACSAAGITEEQLAEAARSLSVAVVPVTAGQGTIPCFVQAVQGIVRHLGFQAEITADTDIVGLAEGVSRGGKILFLADDYRFVALNICSGVLADNNEATARGFAAALSALAGGLEGKEVLVLGAGPVGSAAINFLKKIGARVSVFDIDEARASALRKDPDLNVEPELSLALQRHRYLFDATPQGDFLDLGDLHPEAALALPGMPLGLTARARTHYQGRVVHDPLQIGAATMLAMAVSAPDQL